MTAAAGSAAYLELTVDTAEDAAEALTNFLWEQGAVGVVQEELAATARLRAFFPAGAAAGLAVRVDAYIDGLRALGHALGIARLEPVVDADWAAAWREHFRPVPVGRGLLVAPPWAAPVVHGRTLLIIEPGRAFGTGHHGTTAGCLELLEDLAAAERPARALDLGTGSGILAIAAARLGVGEVLACDSDPDAVAAVEGNAARNGVTHRVQPMLADAATLVVAPAPLVLANLLAAAHRTLAPRYAALVAPGGALVLGGLLDAESDDVARELSRHGFRRESARSLDGWTSLALRHAALHRHV